MQKTEGTIPDSESVKKYLEKREASTVDDEFPHKFLQYLILRDLRLDLIQPGRVVYSMNIPPRLLVRTLFNLLHTFDDVFCCLFDLN